jgi:hypothetical protein
MTLALADGATVVVTPSATAAATSSAATSAATGASVFFTIAAFGRIGNFAACLGTGSVERSPVVEPSGRPLVPAVIAGRRHIPATFHGRIAISFGDGSGRG